MMATNYLFTAVSGNKKTGPIPVTTSPEVTCPPTCGMFKACYAKFGPLSIWWRRLNDNVVGIPWSALLKKVEALPNGQLWRHSQAGDLPGVGSSLRITQLKQLVKANKGKRGFTYTHKPLKTKAERQAIKQANKNGFTINLSADSLQMADNLVSLGVGPVVVVLPHTTRQNVKTPAGKLVVICPAATHADVTCATCKLCAWSQRSCIIGFPAHGPAKGEV